MSRLAGSVSSVCGPAWAVMGHDTASCANLQEEAASVSQQREQLVLAEKLFGMDITGYPDLVQVCAHTNYTTLHPMQAEGLWLVGFRHQHVGNNSH